MPHPRFPVRLLTSLSLVLAATPGHACKKIAGIAAAGAPCTGLAIAQAADLSFSIRPSGCRHGAGETRPEQARTVALGDSLKADATIFTRFARKEKDISDARTR